LEVFRPQVHLSDQTERKDEDGRDGDWGTQYKVTGRGRGQPQDNFRFTQWGKKKRKSKAHRPSSLSKEERRVKRYIVYTYWARWPESKVQEERMASREARASGTLKSGGRGKLQEVLLGGKTQELKRRRRTGGTSPHGKAPWGAFEIGQGGRESKNVPFFKMVKEGHGMLTGRKKELNAAIYGQDEAHAT